MAFNITQNDTSPALISVLSDDEDPVDLTNANEVRFIMENKYQEVIIDEGLADSVNILNAEGGEVEYVFDASQTATVGTYKAEFEVEFSSGAIETFPTGDPITINISEEIA